jgi:hypothetical protein
MATWPTDLQQQLLVAGYQRKPQPGVSKTPMDSGPPKQRQIDTSAPEDVKGTVRCQTEELRQIFWSFWRDTLGQGALPFDWVEPGTDTPRSLQFVGDEPTETKPDGIWQFDFALLLLP